MSISSWKVCLSNDLYVLLSGVVKVSVATNGANGAVLMGVIVSRSEIFWPALSLARSGA